MIRTLEQDAEIRAVEVAIERAELEMANALTKAMMGDSIEQKVDELRASILGESARRVGFAGLAAWLPKESTDGQ